jgi:hypothetical protein
VRSSISATSSRQTKRIGHQRIFLGQRFPAVAIDAQGIGETPSVHMVGFVAAGHFALAIAIGGAGEGASRRLDREELVEMV